LDVIILSNLLACPLCRGGINAYFDSLGELKSPGILSTAAFADGITMLCALIRRSSFSRDGESAIVDVKSYIFLLGARQLEDGGDDVFLCVFM
jgi:hypothetical protein